MKPMMDESEPSAQPIEVVLPKSTPGVSELVSGWSDGGEYHVKITQSGSDDKSVTLQIEQMEMDTEEDDTEMEDEAPEPVKTRPPSEKVGIPYRK